MLKIGEFSKLAQISIRMLRYYDEAGLLKPAKIDNLTGYRMYSVEQIPVLNRITYLRDSGFNISEIAATLDKKAEWTLEEQLDKKYAQIEKTIQHEREKLRKIELAKSQILTQKTQLHFGISIKSIPSYQVLSLRKIIPNYYCESDLWQELSTFAAKEHIQGINDTFSIYHDIEYKETNVDIEICAPVKKTGTSTGCFTYRKTEPVPTMAFTMVYGDFSNIAEAYKAFAKWLQKNNQYQISGANRQIVHRGPFNEHNPEKYLTELQIPLVPI